MVSCAVPRVEWKQYRRKPVLSVVSPILEDWQYGQAAQALPIVLVAIVSSLVGYEDDVAHPRVHGLEDLVPVNESIGHEDGHVGLMVKPVDVPVEDIHLGAAATVKLDAPHVSFQLPIGRDLSVDGDESDFR